MTLSVFERVVSDIEARFVENKNHDGFKALTAVMNFAHPVADQAISGPRITLVVGTNGKGSFCATLTQILVDQGFSVGTFTSPHLESIRERIRINTIPVSEDTFVEAYERVIKIDGSQSLSRFELLALMAWEIFEGRTAEVKAVDYLIVEAGIGGRKDATRALPYDTVVVTKLGLDHTEILGPRIEDIEFEKLSVLRSGKFLPILLDKPIQYLVDKFLPPFAFESTFTKRGLPPVTFVSNQGCQFKLGIPFNMGTDAAALALAWIEQAGLSVNKALASLEKVKWPGRAEYFELDQTLLSGDHNPQGIILLIDSLKYYMVNSVKIVLGVSQSKDLDSIVSLLKSTGYEIILTQTPFKPYPREDIMKHVDAQTKFIPSPIEAFQHARQGLSKSDMVLVTGSLYLVGLIRSELIKK